MGPTPLRDPLLPMGSFHGVPGPISARSASLLQRLKRALSRITASPSQAEWMCGPDRGMYSAACSQRAVESQAQIRNVRGRPGRPANYSHLGRMSAEGLVALRSSTATGAGVRVWRWAACTGAWRIA
jgi:hypothetical protein